jgi:ribosomal subunit interface protein
MNIIIKKNINLTPALEDYLQKKFTTLEKLITDINKTNPAELTIEVGRTTNHHRKGDVYRAAAKLHLARITLRADEEAENIRIAIDAAKDTLREEIEKYKDRNLR